MLLEPCFHIVRDRAVDGSSLEDGSSADLNERSARHEELDRISAGSDSSDADNGLWLYGSDL